MGKVIDPLRHQRYDREVKRTNETAEEITRDAQGAYTVNALTTEQRAHLREMAQTYRSGALRLLRYLYDVEEPWPA